MSSPWSTKIVDYVSNDEGVRRVLKGWIWADRLMWSASTAALILLSVGLLK